MKNGRTILVLAAVFSLAAAFPSAGGKDDKDKQKARAEGHRRRIRPASTAGPRTRSRLTF